MMPPQPYPGMYYQPLAPEHFLTRRNVWLLNAVGLAAMWIGFLVYLTRTTDPNIIGFGRFLIFSGGVLGALASTAGGLGSKRTSDMQNLGLLIWGGLLLLVAAAGAGLLGFTVLP